MLIPVRNTIFQISSNDLCPLQYERPQLQNKCIQYVMEYEGHMLLYILYYIIRFKRRERGRSGPWGISICIIRSRKNIVFSILLYCYNTCYHIIFRIERPPCCVYVVCNVVNQQWTVHDRSVSFGWLR